MSKTVEALRRDLSTVRTGRASPGLVENLKVDYYGAPTPLNQIASISVPEPRMIAIQPWDRQAIGPIEKAIQKSDLGLNPSNDGVLIRLVLPQLTEDRRKELVKVVHKKVEEGRVAVRNVRRDCIDSLRRQLKNKEITEDDERRVQEELQKLTDRFVGEVDHVGKEKESELLEV
jgi:ribosome recycling factor